MTEKEAFISRLRRAAAVRVVPPRRAIVAVRPAAETEFAQLCTRYAVPAVDIGAVGGHQLEVTDTFVISLKELADVHGGAIPAIFG